MKTLKSFTKLAFKNIRPITAFEIIYKMTSVVLFVPLLLGMFNFVMLITDYRYLTFENISGFILRPATLIALAFILIIAAAYAMIDISAVVFTLDQSIQGKTVTLGQIFKFAVKNSLRVLNVRNILIVPVVLLLLPFVNIGLASGFLTTVSIPEFILDYIKANSLLYPLFAIVTVMLTVLSVRWLYAFYYFTVENLSFNKSRRKSTALGKGSRIRDFALMLLAQLLLAIIYLLFILIMITAAGIIGKIFSGIFLLKWVGSTAIWLAIVLSLAIIAALAVPVGYSIVGILFYNRKAETGEEIIHTTAPILKDTHRFGKTFKAIKILIVLAIAVGSLTLGFLLSTGKLNPEIEYVRTMQVTAHRGASVLYPENTMAAFRGAAQLGADWIELDVQQTKDGKIIVAHDTNLQRTTGININTWETDYSEISKLDAGSFFSSAFAGEQIPLLTEVVEFAKDANIKLNIELKPTGHEIDFEKTVVDIITDADYADNCVITSQVYEVLERVEDYDSSITTVYVMSLAYGDILSLGAVDIYSIEATSITRSLVSDVHNAGKEIYAWTVNTREGIEKMIKMNVDNIITDNIELAKECIYDSKYSSLFEEYVNMLQ